MYPMFYSKPCSTSIPSFIQIRTTDSRTTKASVDIFILTNDYELIVF